LAQDQEAGGASRAPGRAQLLLQAREADQEYCTKVDSLLYAGNNLEKGPRDFRAGRQASAEDQAGHSAADARAGAVAEAGVAHARPLHSQDVEAEQRLSRLSKAFRRGRSSVRYSPWVTQAHICAYYAASDRCTMVAQPADNEVKK
jgi:hypothetical protein